MRRFFLYPVVLSVLASTLLPDAFAAPLKPRLVVLTDIGPNSLEPDDRESMIRLFAHADLFEIEGLIATTGWNTGNYPLSWMDSITVTIAAYEKDLTNLRKRSGQTSFLSDESRQELGYWPSAAYLRSRTMPGSSRMGYSVLGDNNNSSGSDQIIRLADESDGRPLHIAVWGGGNTVAQAIWRVQKERSAEQLKSFLHKLRIYTITDQDKPWGSTVAFSISSHQWMRRQFAGDLLFIWDECAWLFQNATGVSRWSDYAANIQAHGYLGAQYPPYRWGVEGDSPSFFYLMLPALSNPDAPQQGGWGGYFEWMKSPDSVTYAYTNYQGTAAYDTCYKYANYFYRAIFNNFSARMDWAKEGRGNRNPVAVVNNDSGGSLLTIRPLQGSAVTLDAATSFDPDGNTLTFKWWTMPKAGTFTQPVSITGAGSNRATVSIPANAAGKTIHVICEVTDNGTPELTSYRRIIFEPVSQVATVPARERVLLLHGSGSAGSVYFDLRGRQVAASRQNALSEGVFLRREGGDRISKVMKSAGSF